VIVALRADRRSRDLDGFVAAGEGKAAVARTYGISREMLYQYLKMAEDENEPIGGEARLLS